MNKYLFAFFCFCIITPAFAQKKKPVEIRVDAAIFKFHAQKPATLECVASGRVLKGKLNESRIAFFAQNDLRQIPMELYRNDGNPEMLRVCVKKKAKQYVIFTASLEELFTLNPAQTPYRWKWKGAAKPPASPVTDVAGEKVRSVKCWYVLQTGKQFYTSDTSFIQIQQ